MQSNTFILRIMVCLVLLLCPLAGWAQARLYVDIAATGNDDGTSWTHAFDDLQDALDPGVAQVGDTILVAEGTYVPSQPTNPGNPFSRAFVLPEGVVLMGGFGGPDNIDPVFGKVRDLETYESILDGLNQYEHLLTIDGLNQVEVNGMVVEKGGDGQNLLGEGGGLLILNSSPVFRSTRIRSNISLEGAGGVIRNGAPEFYDCKFTANNATAFTLGQGRGGALLVENGDPFFENCEFEANTAGGFGGAIFMISGSLEFTGCSFRLNSCDAADGAVMVVNGSLDMEECEVSENENKSQNGSSIIYLQSGAGAHILNSRFESNLNSGIGGVIQLDADSLQLDGCMFADNSTSTGAGAILNQGFLRVIDCLFLRNSVNIPSGGAISNWGTLIVERSRFRSNTVTLSANDGGGAIHNTGILRINDSEFTSNQVSTGNGGAISNAGTELLIQHSSFNENIVNQGDGGAIYNLGKARLTNILLFDNAITGNSGEFSGNGGGIFHDSPDSLVLIHCTVAENDVSVFSPAINQFNKNGGGGIYTEQPSVYLFNSVVAGNVISGGGDLSARRNLYARFDSTQRYFLEGFNLIGELDTNLIIKRDPQTDLVNFPTETNLFDEPEEYGGFGPSVAPANLSLPNPIIDAIPNTAPVLVTTDQRGAPRDLFPDRGAFEYRPAQVRTPLIRLCPESSAVIDSIVIRDAVGGAFYPGESQTLIIEPPFEYTFTPNQGDVAIDAPSADLEKVVITEDLLLVIYSKEGTSEPMTLAITDLELNASPEAKNDSSDILLISGTARIGGLETAIEDSISLAQIITGAGSIPDPNTRIDPFFVCDQDLTFFDASLVAAQIDESLTGFWRWQVFDDQGLVTTSTDPGSFSAVMPGPGGYVLNLVAGPDSACATPIQPGGLGFTILPKIRVNPDDGFFDDFEEEKLWTDEWFPIDEFVYSWVYGPMDTTTYRIPAADNAGSIGWHTELAYWSGIPGEPVNPDTTGYFDNEISWVNSPCFDLSQLERPVLGMDLFIDLESTFDGAVMEISYDGVNWQALGPSGRDVDLTFSDLSGWYNQSNIDAFFQLDAAEIFSDSTAMANGIGWSGTGEGWKQAALRLDGYLDQNQPDTSLRFRILLLSDFETPGNANSGVPLGIAFDNFFIQEREKAVLIEHFVDPGSPVNDTEDLQNLVAQNDGDVIPINYVVGLPDVNSDPDASLIDKYARAHYYGLVSLPASTLDGNQYIDTLAGSGLALEQEQINARLLAPSVLDIQIDTGAATVTIIPGSDAYFDRNMVLRVAIVEDTVVIDGLAYADVLRKMVPHAAGYRIPPGTLRTDVPVQFQEVVWGPDANPAPQDFPGLDRSRLRLIAFVQDEDTKEVVDVALSPVSVQIVPFREGPPPLLAQPHGFRVYPTPAHSFLMIELDQAYPQTSTWTLYDLSGRPVFQGSFEAEEWRKEVDVSHLPAGFYQLEISRKGRVALRQKVNIAR